MHLLKYSESEDASGNWHCNDLEELGKGSSIWHLPSRMLKKSPAEYLKWVIENYKPDTVKYSDDYSVVFWTWKSQTQMRKFKNAMNALARKNNFMIC